MPVPVINRNSNILLLTTTTSLGFVKDVERFPIEKWSKTFSDAFLRLIVLNGISQITKNRFGFFYKSQKDELIAKLKLKILTKLGFTDEEGGNRDYC